MAPILSDPSTQSSQEIFKLTLELYALIPRSKCANSVLCVQDELAVVLEVDQNIAGPVSNLSSAWYPMFKTRCTSLGRGTATEA